MLKLGKPWQPISFRCFHRVINYVILLKLKKKTMKTSSEVSSQCPKAEQSTSSEKIQDPDALNFSTIFILNPYLVFLSQILKYYLLIYSYLSFMLQPDWLAIWLCFFLTSLKVAIDTSKILYYLRTSGLLSLEFYYH